MKNNWIDQFCETSTRICDANEFGNGYSSPRIQWLGHASFRIDWFSKSLLIDPVFAPNLGLSLRKYKHPKDSSLDHIDAVLISHAHMDHFHNPSLNRIGANKIYLPKGSEKFLSTKNRHKYQVQPVTIGDCIQVGELTIQVVYAKHGGWRFPWDQKGLFACGYVISARNVSIYYAGDTAYGSFIRNIGEKFSPTIGLLPIGAYSPRFVLKEHHMNPEDAIQASIDLKTTLTIPFHMLTYRISFEPMNEPLMRFKELATKENISWALPI
jgi:L-ascorbate metabolism protein UlaG (beta-lactamase superfamily)